MSSPLVQSFRNAVVQGDTAKVVELLRQEPRLANVEVVKGKPALVVAAGKGRAAMTKVLLDNGANVNQAYYGNDTALMAAAEYGDANIIDMLVEKGANIEAENSHGMGMTALAIAVQAGNAEAVETLLTRKANTDVVTEEGSLVEIAAYNGNARIVRALLEAGADGGGVDEDRIGETDANYHQIKQLINKYCKMQCREIPLVVQPCTSFRELMKTVEAERWKKERSTVTKEALAEVVQLEPDCIHSHTAYMMTPLHVVVRAGRVDLVKLLLDAGANIKATDVDGNTPLHLIPCQTPELVELLVSHGADIEAKNIKGRTALIEAAKISEQIVRTLLNLKARVDATGMEGETTLHVAVLDCWEQPSITELLCERGADVNAIDKHKQTPLHWAANQRPNNTIISRVLYRDFGDIMEQSAAILLKYKADVNVRDDKGWTPLRYADAPRIEKIFDLIKAYGGTY